MADGVFYYHNKLSTANQKKLGTQILQNDLFLKVVYNGRTVHQAYADEFPQHKVSVDPFYLDAHEVTNAEFDEFVKATGYITVAEKDIDWEEIKIQLPKKTLSLRMILKAGSLS